MSIQLAPFPELAPSAASASPYNRYLLNVEFEGIGGEEWSSVGGGETVREAIDARGTRFPPALSGSSFAGTTSGASKGSM